MGIIYGLYFRKSIALILPILFLLYIICKLNRESLSKYKAIRYLKVLLDIKCIFVVLLSAIISNTYFIYLEYRYDEFYKNIPETINEEAVIIRRSKRKRI